ncbi:MAG TPA: glutamine--tRNA ligase/YqeY domain fusion protein [Firmicutes bacterium]|nr:glutamine--tRNA ligase/YqeY domain fusion protein [Bacillota bacterium]
MEEMNKVLPDDTVKEAGNFIHELIDKDLAEGVYDRVQTRFPPEPNGYLHIGHVKAICIDFGTAEKYGGTCNLRLDDTNPTKEDVEYVDAIKEDIQWLGFNWDHVYFASDYFDFIYECAIRLIQMGKAYVCDLTAEEMREYRGTLTQPGRESPYRNRSVEENLDLFKRMTAGEFENGARVLRAKIDMASPNMNMRDPIIYRILKASHHRTGDKWCVYPMYDFAHPLSDTYEKVTHSLCTLEFEDHRPLYDWFLKELGFENPSRQIEFARMNVNYTLTSKRRCLKLVNEKLVSGWDDPRMATICGMRRRGYPAAALRDFCEKIGVSKAYSVVDYAMLEACVRDNLNWNAERAMAVLRPLRVVIDNYPEGQTEEIEVEVNPNQPEKGKRKTVFSRELYIEQDDFMIEPVKGYFRLSPGREVRLKGAYFVTCTSWETDADGHVTAVHCTYDPETKGGNAPDGRKVKGTIHWVSAENAVDAEVRLYDRLFTVENPSEGEGQAFYDHLNPDSLVILNGCKIEPDVAAAPVGTTFQFMRQGYFCIDSDTVPGHVVINRTVALKDSWAKKQ